MEDIFIILYKGLLLGLFLAILVGPLLVALVQAGIEGGRKAGFAVASGIWISDIIILSTLFFARNFLEQILTKQFVYIFGICGAIILFFIAWKNLKGIYPKLLESPKKKKSRILTGFLINTINPFTFFFWSGVILFYRVEEQFTSNEILLLLLTIMIVIILTDTLKVFFASFLQKQFKSGAVMMVQKVSGIVFIIFGIILLWRIFFTEISLGPIY